MKHKLQSAITVGCTDGLLSRLKLELEDIGAVLDSELPDAQSAIEQLLLTLNGMRVFLFHLKSADDLPQLKRLADAFSGHPVVALIDKNDSSLIIGSNRQGATQVVPLPLDRDDFRACWDRVCFQFGGPPAGAEVIAVAGVTGGCGATAIASNLAYEIAHLREGSCILVELSLQLGKLANYFDVDPPFTTQDLFKDIDRLDSQRVEQALAPIKDNFSVLTGPHRSLTPYSVNSDDVRRLIHFTRKLANVVVLDVPCTLDGSFFEVLGAANHVVLVSEQKIPSLRSLKLVCDALDRQQPVQHRTLVINRYNPTLPGLSVKKLEEVLNTSGFETISNDFAAMNATLDHGRPLRVEAPRSRALADIAALAGVLFPEVGPNAPGANGRPFFSHLSRRLGLKKVGH